MKIALTGGGTGGHVYPNMALLPELKKYFGKIIYIGSFDSIEKQLCMEENIRFFPIQAVKLIRGFDFKNFTIPFKLQSCISEAKKILQLEKPDIIFSKGGYVSLPVVIAGKRLGIPVVVHESDLTLGLANKIGCRYAKELLLSFNSKVNTKCKITYTGTPIRNQILLSRAKKIFKNSRPTVLIFGGSMGAKSLNNEVFQNLEEILKDFNVIHLVGKGNTNCQIQYDNYCQMEFAKDIGALIKGADFIVSRGGANSLFEILALKKPALIFPLSSKTSRGDQVENAEFFYTKGLIHVHDPYAKLSYELVKLQENSKTIVDNIKKANITDGKEPIIDRILINCKHPSIEGLEGIINHKL